jgi:hypothetical protein
VPNQNIHTLVCMLNCIYFMSLNRLLGESCNVYLFISGTCCLCQVEYISYGDRGGNVDNKMGLETKT